MFPVLSPQMTQLEETISAVNAGFLASQALHFFLTFFFDN